MHRIALVSAIYSKVRDCHIVRDTLVYLVYQATKAINTVV